jgi:hypothetical protein
MHSMGKCVERSTLLWLRLWFYIIQGFTNALWKKIIINGQLRNKHFFIVMYHSSLVEPLWMLRAFVKCAMVLAKRPQCLIFSTVTGGMNILRSYLNCSTIVNWKTRKRTNNLKGSRRMGGGRIFLKSLCDTSFNKDPSNESNFGRIHLAGHYL